ncbi:MAG: agmatine deiminase family protein, partial [Candidatus Acidiferrales bacterium]
MKPITPPSSKLQSPAALGYRMPAEWAPHAATWLAWPHNATDWPGKLEPIHWVYGEIVRKLAPGEMVRLLVHSAAIERKARSVLKQVGVDLKRVQFLRWPTNRGWTRDCGPIFVTRHAGDAASPLPAPPGEATALPRPLRSSQPPASGRTEKAILHFQFNAWARYPDWRLDNMLPERAAKKFGHPLLPVLRPNVGAGLSRPSKPATRARYGRPKSAPARDLFVLEGGAIDVNGHGAVLTTEECLLDHKTQARNPGLTHGQIEYALRGALGVSKVLWLGRGIAGDDTHGHVDDLCRFVNRTTVVMCREGNPRDANYRPLQENWERIAGLRLEDGSHIQAVPLPMPAPLFFDSQRLPASYANFYIANAAVIVPTFNDPADRIALGTLAELFPDRPVVGIHAVDLAWGFGAL